jgi:hypothetical protein
VWLGNHELAKQHLAHAIRLGPLDPLIVPTRVALAHAHFFCGEYDTAAAIADLALQARPDRLPALRAAAASHALAGRLDLAEKARHRIQLLDPDRRVSNLPAVLGPYRRSEDLAKLANGLRRAGLSE